MSEAIGSTGRIDKALIPTARRILFERNLEEQIHQDLSYMCQIDLAHVLMLAERRLLSATTAKSLLRAITRLIEQRFAALKARPSLRGLFLLYEGYLIETEGQKIGGMLQTGRSRNDLNATLLKMRLREPYALLIKAALRLQAVLIRRARKYSGAVMPAYTHSQAAMPTTYGHYLAGVAEAIRRDVDGLMDATREIDVSPLGAGAVAGTTVPIDPASTAELLGFTSSAPHSVDAVASRDVALRLLSAMAIYGATLSRTATDLLQWLTSEFQFLSLPDDLVGSSSAMPQKKNPFLLEHVQGRTSAALGAFVSSLAATRNVPFTNSISVGTESVRPLWNALADTTDATTLLRLIVCHGQPNLARMEQRASDGFTTATEIAVRMVMEKGMDFRSAHRGVGKAVSETLSRGLTSFEEMATREPDLFGFPLDGIDPRSCVERAKYGGGPAPESMDQILEGLLHNWRRHQNAIKTQVGRWKEAQSKLKQLVNEFSLE